MSINIMWVGEGQGRVRECVSLENSFPVVGNTSRAKPPVGEKARLKFFLYSVSGKQLSFKEYYLANVS